MPAKKILLILLLSFIPQLLDSPWGSTVILWNVGQGQFLTWIYSEKCLHFDVGGEKFDFTKITQICRKRENEIFLTHFDQDHISLIPRLLQAIGLQKVCLHVLDQQQTKGLRLAKRWQLKVCPELSFSQNQLQILVPQQPFKNENESSLVFIIQNQVLVPGDSTKKQETQWSQALRDQHIHTLVAGHHGSKTSTSEILLNQLPHLKQVWVSARQARYGHPHSTVTQRLFSRGLPLISSETWGDLIRKLD